MAAKGPCEAGLQLPGLGDTWVGAGMQGPAGLELPQLSRGPGRPLPNQPLRGLFQEAPDVAQGVSSCGWRLHPGAWP